jgi:hypothetical protein
VFQQFFGSHHKIPQNFKILSFDLKMAQKVQNRKKSYKKNRYMRRLFHPSFIKLALHDSFYKLGLMEHGTVPYETHFSIYRVSQNWRTNYLLPYRGCLNVHEKNMEKMFPTKKLIIIFIIKKKKKKKVTQSRTGLQIYEGRDDQLNRPGPMA